MPIETELNRDNLVIAVEGSHRTTLTLTLEDAQELHSQLTHRLGEIELVAKPKEAEAPKESLWKKIAWPAAVMTALWTGSKLWHLLSRWIP